MKKRHCKKIEKKHKNEYDLNEILSMLLYTRVLYPGSKRSSLEDKFCEKFGISKVVVCTDLEYNAAEIIKVNGGRWVIEDCFRITKTEFGARHLYEILNAGADREVAEVGELIAYVKDGHAPGLVLVPPTSVCQHIQDSFSDDQERDRERVNPQAGFHRAGEEHMFLAVVDDGIVLFEDVTFANRLVSDQALKLLPGHQVSCVLILLVRPRS